MYRLALWPLLIFCLVFSSRATASAESEFWRWVQRNEQSLFDFEQDQERTFDRLAAEMRKIHPNLTFDRVPVAFDAMLARH